MSHGIDPVLLQVLTINRVLLVCFAQDYSELTYLMMVGFFSETVFYEIALHEI